MGAEVIQGAIELVDARASAEKLEQATLNLKADLQQIQGVQRVSSASEEAPDKSKGDGLVGLLMTEIKLSHFKAVVDWLGQNTYGRTSEFKGKSPSGREFEFEVSRPEDLEKIKPFIDEWMQ